ncbi:flagellar assembly protein FliW [Clostridium sp. SHJSY1]|uniref:flagellar assembly protein FliW n=1 Tax=Clostridium sp. SHJSY1 TaxID=2942483 RepID=UPI0028743CE8|nr:flagellar assembly protein FliW [Clostridium sp. SHJSY1]MDS0524122.1 flagellar assembly protein FliW [Clostridium sp. SHJSY1]
MEVLFKNGIPGLEEYKNYILEKSEELEPFNVLQSKENQGLGLVVISPFEVMQDYEIKLSENTIKNLEIKEPNEVLLCTTVTLNSDLDKVTTNLRAPIVINLKNGLGEQIIVDNDKYKIKHPISKGR